MILISNEDWVQYEASSESSEHFNNKDTSFNERADAGCNKIVDVDATRIISHHKEEQKLKPEVRL